MLGSFLVELSHTFEMATWDGSYAEPDGSNYYVNSHSNQAPGNLSTWDYYLPNTSNSYVQNTPAPYTLNSMVFEQSTSNLYNHLDRNTIPPLMPNVVPANNAYPVNGIQQTATNKVHMAPPEGHLNTINNQLPCFFEDNKALTQQAPQNHYYNNRSNNYQNNGKHKDTSKTYPVANIVEHSNLHATANEFVPNQNKWDRGTSVNPNKHSKGRMNNDYQNQSGEQASNNVYFEDNKVRYNDRKYENKRDVGRRWRDDNRDMQSSQHNHNQYNKQDKKDYGKNQNSRRYQNDRFIHNRNFPEKSHNNKQEKDHSENTVSESNANSKLENLADHQDNSNNTNVFHSSVEKENTQSTGSQITKNSKSFSNNSRGDRYYDRKERYNPRDPRDRKSNYSENNGYNRSNYSSRDNKYERRENRNTLTEVRDTTSDWRQRTSQIVNKSTILKRSYNKKYEPDDDADQRERLTEQLNRGQLECLVCCESIRQADYVWSCKNCYHVLHLKCVQKWAMSSQDESGWRCPACQNVTLEVPSDYFCFCGKTKVPEWNRRDIAHSCGEICGRTRSDVNCVHKCTLLCHPGSCPLCLAMVTKTCGCGRTSQTQKCSTGPLLQCEEICDRPLNCSVHKCESKCHHGSCEPCDKIFKQECFCGKNTREETCVLDLPPMYSCENVCNKVLDCGNHKCKEICHPGQCGPCVLKPETVKHCCCGQTLLTDKRESCLDPIATCDKVCSKRLRCGQPSNPHTCQANCHKDDCPECELITKVKCRCGYMDKEIPCRELTTKADDARCEKKCTKKRSCGKHKCNQKCCIDIEHICPLPCSKTLSCGRHKCEQTCHRGRCQNCWRSSFDELYCECGAAVIYPPVACGTRRPACDKPCSREHPCSHEVLHNCHSDPTCPPCTVLTQKWCYGEHELRKAVPCYVNDVSCGLPCNKPISCGRHKCIQMCHSGPCEKPGQVCTQPCTVPRELCGHICAAPCHEGKCPDAPCKEMVKVTCQCGNRTMSRVCAENSRDFQRIASGILASKMADMQLGHSVDLEEVFGQGARKQNQLKTLDCNEDCKMIERNRKLTLGLQIVNPDLSGKLMPKYSEHMKEWGKKDPVFCQMVHDKLTELVQLAKTSKQKSRSYSFESMNRDKRQFIHESCEHFGCESQAYDQEPKRNVVATAVKDRCWLPSYSLLELLQRENGQRKVPGPMVNINQLNRSKLNSTDTTYRSMDVVLNSKRSLKPLPAASASPPAESPGPEIDYFNYNG
ncbi:protein shuttle craft isoform X1 [Nasonia vitripennis]|uniref:Protein shuttle craft n=2 Tax=Nasonia vitripennis TaxID=7425 RepID=A0A7M7ISY0_NASVI|nr:protein shuttle craft isoform X1 [Nasonia vitripennis]